MIDQTLREADAKMDKAVDVAKEDFAAIRTGRAHPQMFAKITADYYGTQTPIQQLAGFQVPEARMVVISPYDMSAKPAIEKAIRDSDLGVNPTDDGKVLRVVLPELTEERRRQFIRLARQYAEEGRVSIRNVRRDEMRDLNELMKMGEISEDDERRAETELQQMTDKYVGRIDEALTDKEAELLEV